MYSGDTELMAVVADIGSSSAKFGFAGEDHPKVLAPASVGVTGDETPQFFVGMEALRVNKAAEVRNPYKDGIIAENDVVQALWDHSYETMAIKPQEHPVVLAEPSDNTGCFFCRGVYVAEIEVGVQN